MTDPKSAGPGLPGWFGHYVRHPKHGPLPALLLILTASTGMVDAVSILALGRVFVANMTGNIVFIGFALAHAPGFSLQASLVALVAFLAGAGAGGIAVAHYRAHRGVLLRNVVAGELVLMGGAAVTLFASDRPYTAPAQDVAVALAAVALGLQNAAVRNLAVPDLTTTVLTMTLTGIAADVRSHDYRIATQRVLAVLTMLAGAFVGALLVLRVSAALALVVACILIAAVLVISVIVSRSPGSWQSSQPR